VRSTLAVPVLGDPAGPQPASDRSGQAWRSTLGGQLVRFAAIGVASTAAYLLLYLLLRTVMPVEAANAISLLATAVANTAANRRITFGIRGRARALSHQVRGLIAFGAGLVLTSSALALLQTVVPRPSRTAELAVLVPANLAATLLRFGLYRGWVFHRGQHAGQPKVQPEVFDSAGSPR